MRIRCAKCDRLVERVEVFAEPSRHGGRIIIAHCHGDRDEMRLTMEFLAGLSREEVRQLEVGEGIAFATSRIAAA